MAIQIPNAGTGNGQTGDNEYVLWQKTINNFSDQTNAASRLVGTATGNVMEVGAFGLGSNTPITNLDADLLGEELRSKGTRFFRNESNTPFSFVSSASLHINGADTFGGFSVSYSGGGVLFYGGTGAGTLHSYVMYTNKNATKDSNGFLKGASPVIDMYDNKIDLNHDAEQQGGITFEKLGVGDYLVKGSLGFAQEGWYVEMPKDANGNVLVAVVYEQLENNDLSIKTYAKKFDDETGDIVANLLKPRDIPTGRFISLRLHELPKEPPVMSEDTQMEEVDSGK